MKLKTMLLLLVLVFLLTNIKTTEARNNIITDSEKLTKYCYLSDNCKLPVGKANFEILLKSRQFRPNPGLEYSLYSKLPALQEKERVHVLIQFEYMPDERKKEELLRNNIQLLG